MKINFAAFEGSEAEFHAAEKFLRDIAGTGITPDSHKIQRDEETTLATNDSEIGEDADWRFPSYEEVTQVLTRRPLSPNTKRLFAILLAAGNEKRIPSSVLMKKLSLSNAEFRGLMGAFGRRFNYTDADWGPQDNVWFFDQEWNDVTKENEYRLAPSVRDFLTKRSDLLK